MTATLLQRFPALHRLEWTLRRRRVPVVRQVEWADCGAACLAMVLGYHGRPHTLSAVKAVLGDGRDGTDALSLLTAAESFGLRGRGLRVEMADLHHVARGSILHWELDHFVVLERVERGGAWVVDPRRGRRFFPRAELSRAFTGVVLELTPRSGASPPSARPSSHAARRIRAYFVEMLRERPLVLRVLVLSFWLRVLALGLPVMTGVIVDRVVPRHDVRLLSIVVAGLVVALLSRGLAHLVRAHTLLQLRTNLDTRMTLGFLDHLVSLPFSFFQRRSTGDLMLRVSGNSSMREILTSSTLSGLLDGALVSIYLAILILVSPTLTVVVLGFAVAEWWVFLASAGRSRALMVDDLEAQSRSHGYLAEMMVGIESLKLAGVEHRAVTRWSHLFVDELSVALARGRLAAGVDAARDLLQGAAPLVLITVGALEVMAGELSLGAMLAAVSMALGVLVPLAALGTSAQNLQLLHGYLERIEDVLGATPERGAGAAAPSKEAGRVALHEVSFRYGPRSPWAVRDVSLDIERGQSVALVGRSGSGKSTLASLILGLHEPSEGRIVHGGRDLAELDLTALRQRVGVVPQHPRLFCGTVRENITLFDPSVSDDDVVRAARLAAIHEEVVAMPMGYDTLLADGGTTLSGGQRQRLALARALVRRPSLILLDEATSALDVLTERRVSDALDGLGCTRIVIAHRLSTVARADVIVVVEGGRLVERGSHAELLQRRGAYAGLVAEQLRLEPS